MDNTGSAHSILDTLRTVEFRLGLKGYNVDEVDEYLEKAAIEAEQVQERLRTANERLRQATERIGQLEAEPQRAQAPRPAAQSESAGTAGPAPVADDSLQRTLLLAQKFVDQAKRESEAEAAETLRRAEERARALLGQAEERARQITTGAEQRLREEVVRLEAVRTRLESDVESMTAHLEEQRSKIRASLSEALKWVDERLQPVPARGVREQGGVAERAAQSVERTGPDGAEAGAGAALAGPSGAPARPADPVGSGSARIPGTPPGQGATERIAPRPTPDERGESPVGAAVGAMNGGLFEMGRGETNGREGNHAPE